LGVAVPFGIGPIALQTQSVGQALLGEPDQVVVLVLGSGDLSAFGGVRHDGLLPLRRSVACATVVTRLVAARRPCTAPGGLLDRRQRARYRSRMCSSLREASMIECRYWAMSLHGSSFCASRLEMVAMVYLSGVTVPSSDHSIGVATGAPGRARTP